MSDMPIHSFLMRAHSFRANDIAVLFALVAMQEMDRDGLISPAVRSRLWCIEDLEAHECAEALSRLEQAGEVEWVEEEGQRGFRVVRFEQFQDLMTDFGRRRYNRMKAREHRQGKEAIAHE